MDSRLRELCRQVEVKVAGNSRDKFTRPGTHLLAFLKTVNFCALSWDEEEGIQTISLIDHSYSPQGAADWSGLSSSSESMLMASEKKINSQL